jgi:hypothetical protein
MDDGHWWLFYLQSNFEMLGAHATYRATSTRATSSCSECHYRKHGLCQVSAALPSAKYRALGKEKHTVNSPFAEHQTLGKEKHSAKNTLPSVGHSAKEDTRQTSATQLTARLPLARPPISARRRLTGSPLWD